MISKLEGKMAVITGRRRTELDAAVNEIAALVAWLAGPEAGFLTGASLTIDGGFNA